MKIYISLKANKTCCLLLFLLNAIHLQACHTASTLYIYNVLAYLKEHRS